MVIVCPQCGHPVTMHCDHCEWLVCTECKVIYGKNAFILYGTALTRAEKTKRRQNGV